MITSVRLQQFRSYSDDSFEFSAGVNILVGPNASGKTNLLESLLMICRGSSYRALDRELIKVGYNWLRIDAMFQNNDSRSLKLIAPSSSKQLQKTFIIDGSEKFRLKFEDRLPVVLFEPEHLRLLSGSPKRRRDFLDSLLSQLYDSYATSLKQYNRLLLQRNALLKQPGALNNELFAWNVRLAQVAEKLVLMRTEFVKDAQAELNETYNQLAATNTLLSMEYSCSEDISLDNYAQKFLKKLDSQLNLDKLRGFTGSGPHRDDLVFTLHDQPAGAVASRGETRTLLLALKMVELKFIEKLRSQKPLLLLDDVFSELDGARRQALTKVVNNYQTIITTTDADAVIEHFSGSKHTHNVIALG